MGLTLLHRSVFFPTSMMRDFLTFFFSQAPLMNRKKEVRNRNHSSVGNTRRLLREEGIGLTPECAARGGTTSRPRKAECISGAVDSGQITALPLIRL